MKRRSLPLLACLAACVPGAWAGEGAPPPKERRWPAVGELLQELPVTVHGFFEARGGLRTQNDARIAKTATVAETRLQLELGKVLDWAEFRLKGDLDYDDVLGQGESDLREAYVLLTPLEFADLKLGRQILTWGTGDLLFINDLFPKDWESFFIGRDDEYLKAPSDAAKLSFFTDLVNLDLVYSARFRPDNYIDGERLSYWSDALGRRAGQDDPVRDIVPDHWFEDDELALRLHKNLGGTELALYAHRGYWPLPAGMDPASGKAAFPKLSVYGASVRGNVLEGIGNVEVGFYDSRDDDGGDDPLVRNSEARLLVGYKREVAKELTATVQYYLEHMLDHGNYERGLPPGVRARDENRHVLTLRLTRMLLRQTLALSLFTYYSPSDGDAYLRPKASYKINDQWSAEVGGNVFLGARDHTFFGQFERDTNAYLGVRYSF